METTMYHRTFCHRNMVCFLGTPQKDAQIPCHCLSSIYAYHVCSCFIIHIDWRDMSVYNIFYIHLYSIFYMWYIMIIYIYTYIYIYIYTYIYIYIYISSSQVHMCSYRPYPLIVLKKGLVAEALEGLETQVSSGGFTRKVPTKAWDSLGNQTMDRLTKKSHRNPILLIMIFLFVMYERIGLIQQKRGSQNQCSKWWGLPRCFAIRDARIYAGYIVRFVISSQLIAGCGHSCGFVWTFFRDTPKWQLQYGTWWWTSGLRWEPHFRTTRENHQNSSME